MNKRNDDIKTNGRKNKNVLKKQLDITAKRRLEETKEQRQWRTEKELDNKGIRSGRAEADQDKEKRITRGRQYYKNWKIQYESRQKKLRETQVRKISQEMEYAREIRLQMHREKKQQGNYKENIRRNPHIITVTIRVYRNLILIVIFKDSLPV